MKLRIIRMVVFLMTISTFVGVQPTADEPKQNEQPQALLDLLSDGATVAVGSTGRNGMRMKGYLKFNSANNGLILVADYQNTPEFQFEVHRNGNLIGLKSLVNNKFLGSSVSTNPGYTLLFSYDDMSVQNAQFVLKAAPNQRSLNPVWLYNRATQGFISVRDRVDEIVTYDHTRTGAQSSIYEELFIEIKTPAPAASALAVTAAPEVKIAITAPMVAAVAAPAPVVAPAQPAGPTQADFQAAFDKLKQALDELKALRAESDRLTAVLASEASKYVADDVKQDQVRDQISAANAEKDALTKQVAAAEAARQDLLTKLMQAVEQLRGLMTQAQQSGTVAPQAVMQAAATLATAPASQTTMPLPPVPTAGQAATTPVATTSTEASPAPEAAQTAQNKKAKKKGAKKSAKKKGAKKKKGAAQKKVTKKKGVQKAAKKGAHKKASNKKSAQKKSSKKKSTKKKSKKRKSAKKAA